MTEAVYVVSSGSYSDYRVLCACPTKKDAEAVARKLRGTPDTWRADARVEALPMVTGEVEQVSVLYLSTNLWDDGSEKPGRDDTSLEWPFDHVWEMAAVVWRWVRAPVHRGVGGRLDVHGLDHALVRKVFSEKRAALRADMALAKKPEWKGRA